MRESPLPPHSSSVRAVLERLRVDLPAGLTESRVAELRGTAGWNEIDRQRGTPRWARLLSQFKELVVWILIAASLLSGLLREWADAAVILAIVILNGAIGFLQEERAGRSLALLRKLSAPTAKVVRDGLIRVLPARELVPGDCIRLETGDSVPADARLVEDRGLSAQESALTGESVPVEKDSGAVVSPETPLADRRNMVFTGTVVVSGTAAAVVVSTGMDTELGRIAGLIERQAPEPTPLQSKLRELGRTLIVVCLAAVALIFFLNLWRGGNAGEVLLLSVSLAVAAVPEGLPAVVTIALALGLERMAKRNALVRTLPSVETLGSVSVICSDKTGTLTRNEMTVREVIAGGRTYRIGGTGYAPSGTVLGPSGESVKPDESPDLALALTIGALCNNARLSPPAGSEGAWRVVGDPTEGALLTAALKAGVDLESSRTFLHEIPFDSGRRLMTVVIRDPEGATWMYTKGAPESVLARCIGVQLDGKVEDLTEQHRRDVLETSARLASEALRVLALAYRTCGTDGRTEDGLVFAGLAGMLDPPREEAREAVRKCRSAGIRPIMVTGDHPATARAIARELELAGAADAVLTGVELDTMSDGDLAGAVERVSVYARVSAEHKLRIVQAWKGRDRVVAMTGDGVNDAPALKAADVGVSMGLSGTDLTREASDIVLTDDNFASIVNAVEEGRRIFDNIQRFVHYLLACNLSEVLLMLVASLAGWPAPLSAIQILWINLVTDGLPALTLAVEPAEPDVMRRGPRPRGQRILTRDGVLRLLIEGALLAAAALLAFALLLRPGDESSLHAATTAAFCVSALSQLAFSLACRSHRYTLPELGLRTNLPLLAAIVGSAALQVAVVVVPALRAIFLPRGGGLEPGTWAWILVLALAPVTIVEVTKIVRARAVRAP